MKALRRRCLDGRQPRQDRAATGSWKTHPQETSEGTKSQSGRERRVERVVHTATPARYRLAVAKGHKQTAQTSSAQLDRALARSPTKHVVAQPLPAQHRPKVDCVVQPPEKPDRLGALGRQVRESFATPYWIPTEHTALVGMTAGLQQPAYSATRKPEGQGPHRAHGATEVHARGRQHEAQPGTEAHQDNKH